MFSSKIEKLYYRGIHWSIFTSIMEISISEEITEVYIRDSLTILSKVYNYNLIQCFALKELPY